MLDMIVNLEDVKEFIENEKFHQFLLSNTSDFAVAGWVLQTLLDALNDANKQLAAAATQEQSTED